MMSEQNADYVLCGGVTALGDCDKRAKFKIVARERDPQPRWACGIHLAQVVKHALSWRPTADKAVVVEQIATNSR